MKIFIDFDDVLFNTKDFIRDIKIVFRRHGVSEDVFSETYKNANRFSLEGRKEKKVKKMRRFF